MRPEWDELPRGDVAAQWASVYASINRKGEIVLSRYTYQRLGATPGFQILFDKRNNRIGLKPISSLQIRNVYPAAKYGRRGAKVIRAHRLLTEYGITVPDTLEFRDAEIDDDGILVLDLRTARVSPKAHSQCRQKHER